MKHTVKGMQYCFTILVFILIVFGPASSPGADIYTTEELDFLDPAPDIKVNGSDGPLTVSIFDPVSITVSLNPGLKIGQNADWFIIAELNIGPFSQYFSIIYPDHIVPGVKPFIQFRLFPLPDTEVYNGYIPIGNWIFHFGVDNNADGKVDWTWTDSVNVFVVEF